MRNRRLISLRTNSSSLISQDLMPATKNLPKALEIIDQRFWDWRIWIGHCQRLPLNGKDHPGFEGLISIWKLNYIFKPSTKFSFTVSVYLAREVEGEGREKEEGGKWEGEGRGWDLLKNCTGRLSSGNSRCLPPSERKIKKLPKQLLVGQLLPSSPLYSPQPRTMVGQESRTGSAHLETFKLIYFK